MSNEQKKRIEEAEKRYSFLEKMTSADNSLDLPEEAYDLSKVTLPDGLIEDEDGNIKRIGDK